MQPGIMLPRIMIFLNRTKEMERLDRLASQEDTGLSVGGPEADSEGRRHEHVALPTFRGEGLQPGVNLDDSAAILELMESSHFPE
jgi:hypothetical protein